MGISVASTEWLFVHCFHVELQFGNVGFCGGRKTGVPGENPRRKDENQQQTQPTCGVNSGNRTRTTRVLSPLRHPCSLRLEKGFLALCFAYKLYLVLKLVSLVATTKYKAVSLLQDLGIFLNFTRAKLMIFRRNKTKKFPEGPVIWCVM